MWISHIRSFSVFYFFQCFRTKILLSDNSARTKKKYLYVFTAHPRGVISGLDCYRSYPTVLSAVCRLVPDIVLLTQDTSRFGCVRVRLNQESYGASDCHRSGREERGDWSTSKSMRQLLPSRLEHGSWSQNRFCEDRRGHSRSSVKTCQPPKRSSMA